MKVSAPHRGLDLRSGYALPSSQPLCGRDSKPGRTPLIVRGNLSRQPEPALNAIFVAALVEVITIPLFGWLSDRIGRRIFYFLGALFTACFAFPLFWLLSTKDPQIVILTVAVALSFGHGTMFG